MLTRCSSEPEFDAEDKEGDVGLVLVFRFVADLTGECLIQGRDSALLVAEKRRSGMFDVFAGRFSVVWLL